MRGLTRDQRGAIMVLGLFMALFATGCLVYLFKLGGAITEREHLQDAADAAAFSAAVLHARGMNVIALVNMTMAALLAVLIVLKLVEMAGYVGVTFATGLAFVTGGASLSAVPPLTQAAISAREAHDAAKPVVQTSLRVLRIAARGVRVVMPSVAQTRSVLAIADQDGPAAIATLVVPSRVTLPTRDGSYDELCTKAGDYVGALINVPFEGMSLPGFSIGEITGGLIDTGSAWFCEADAGGRPGTSVTRRIWHPILPKSRACEALGHHDADEAEHQRVCGQAEQETVAADEAIDPDTGHCVPAGGDACAPDGLYELRASLAQSACAPRERDDASLSKFTWQARSFTRRYVWDEGEWKVAEPIVSGTEQYDRRQSARRPCGPSGGIGREWSSVRRRDGELVPICSNVAPPSTPPIGSQHTVDLVHTEVLQMFRCFELRTERREIEGEGGGLAASEEEGQQMAPQLIAEGAELGEEDFQLRALAIGPGAGALEGVAFAQAEHYFDDAEATPADLLWRMGWTARLRRFREPGRQPAPAGTDDLADAALHQTGAAHTTFESACAALAPEHFPCAAIDLELFFKLAAH